jgi:hypothetical protein
MTLGHLLDGLLEFATNEQGAKSVTKALKEGGKETLDKVIERMCEPAKGWVFAVFSFFYAQWRLLWQVSKGDGCRLGTLGDWEPVDCKRVAYGAYSYVAVWFLQRH